MHPRRSRRSRGRGTPRHRATVAVNADDARGSLPSLWRADRNLHFDGQGTAAVSLDLPAFSVFFLQIRPGHER